MTRLDNLAESGGFHPGLFDIKDLADEIRVDQLCENLLRIFYHYQVDELSRGPEAAGANARGADYLLREFIIGDRRENLFRIEAIRIRQFAGNWYITRALEPSLSELQSILRGTAEFYRFLSVSGVCPPQLASEIERHCQSLDYYQLRIDAFWAIRDDGFAAWRSACPLDP